MKTCVDNAALHRNWTLEQLVAWVETVEPKQVQPKYDPAIVIERRESRAFELQRLRQEAQEAEQWQAVRAAFGARRTSHRNRLSGVNVPIWAHACAKFTRGENVRVRSSILPSNLNWRPSSGEIPEVPRLGHPEQQDYSCPRRFSDITRARV